MTGSSFCLQDVLSACSYVELAAIARDEAASALRELNVVPEDAADLAWYAHCAKRAFEVALAAASELEKRALAEALADCDAEVCDIAGCGQLAIPGYFVCASCSPQTARGVQQ